MKGHPDVIKMLNDVLTAELTSVNQYFLGAKIFLNWGYEYLGKKLYRESIGEMKHADQIIDRVLLLDGLPNLQKLDKVHTGETVVEQLRLDLANETTHAARVNNGIKLARELGDNGTVLVLEGILKSTEEHADWLESQLELVKQVGEQNYLSQQIKPAS